MGSRCSWKAVVKSALTVSQPPSTYMVYVAGGFFLKNLKLIKNNDNALPKTKPLYSHIKLENYVHAA